MFKLSTSDRLGRWKHFRTEINNMLFSDAIAATQEFWQSCPFTPYYLEPSDASNWPDPWQLITENFYCDLAKVLGIVYTLHLSKHGKILAPEIRIYQDPSTRHIYNVAWFEQGKYVVNLIEDAVVNKEHLEQQKLKLLHSYSAKDLHLEQY